MCVCACCYYTATTAPAPPLLLLTVSVAVQTIGELERSIAAARQRLKKITDHKTGLGQRVRDSEEELSRLETEMRSQLNQAAATDLPPPVTTLYTSVSNRSISRKLTI